MEFFRSNFFIFYSLRGESYMSLIQKATIENDARIDNMLFDELPSLLLSTNDKNKLMKLLSNEQAIRYYHE